MNVEMVRILFDYHYWAMGQVWACVDPLSEEQFNPPSDYSIGSVREQLIHLMGAENIWFSRLRGVSPNFFDTKDFPTRQSIRDKWAEIEQGGRDYLAGLDEDALADFFAYYRTNGEAQREKVWVALFQLVNHGTDHRAQILALIHSLGAETTPQDFIFYTRQRHL
jgi:uncharacterized damage-inducible protein DinB